MATALDANPSGMPTHNFKDKNFVELTAIDSTSRAASIVELITYLATEPKPGQQSVTARSLSTVFGIAMQFKS